MVKKLNIIIFLLISPAFISPQNQNIKFEHLTAGKGLNNTIKFNHIGEYHTERLTVADGLLDNTIRKIAQDSLGFIWMGHVGLQRYDGSTFTDYLHDPDDDRSIRSNYLYNIFTDRRKRLWISVNGGIDQYIYKKDHFKHYYFTDQKCDTIPYNIYSLSEDTSGNLYAGLNFAEGGNILKYDWYPRANYSQRGVYRFDVENDTFVALDWVNDLLNNFCDEGYLKKTEQPGLLEKTIVFPAKFFNSTLYYSFSIIRKNSTVQNEPFPDFIRSRKLKLSHNRIELPAVKFMEVMKHSSIKYAGGKDHNSPVEVHFRFDVNELEKPLAEGDRIQIKGDFYPLCWFREPYLKCISFDNNNRLWAALFPLGLFVFDLENKSCRQFIFNPLGNTLYSGSNYTFHSNQINDILIARNGHVWIATWGGLNRYIPGQDTMISYYNNPFKNNGPFYNQVISLGEDPDGNIWIGNYQNAVSIFNPGTDRFYSIKENIGAGSKYGMLVDKSGIIWVGSDNQGIIKIVTNMPDFESYDLPYPDRTISFLEDTDGTTWIGENQVGLLKYKRKTKEIITLGNLWNNDSIPLTGIADLYQDKSGILWLCTLDGLYNVNPRTNRIKHFEIDSVGYNEKISNISALCEVNGVLWVTSEKGFLSRIDPVRATYKSYYFGGEIFDLAADSQGNLWFIGNKGLGKFDPDKEQFEIADEKGNGINLRIDRNGMIWYSGAGIMTFILHSTGYSDLGTGLNSYDPKTKKITRITTSDGLLSASIMGLELDDSNNVWISFKKGLSRYNPLTKTFRHYFKGSGLSNDEFLPWTDYKNKKGEIFFATSDGFVIFHPDSLEKYNFIPDIVLTGIDVNNAPLETAEYKTINQSVNTLKEIELDYDQNDLTFSFAALDYRFPKRNKYTFMLENYDDNWRYESTESKAYYVNIDPGDYIFKVKGSNSYGVWNEDPALLKITILPPWWETQLAYIFYFVFFIALILGIWRFQTNRLKIRQQLEMEHFEAEKLREVDHLKSRFFANISHEFRTPLTLIKGPVKQILTREFKGNLDEQYRMILRYSDRLLNLINQILDLSKLESGRMKLQVSQTDLIQNLKGIVQSFASLAERKKVTFKFKTLKESLIGYVDRDKLEKIVTNLLSNAFKFTPEGGEVTINLSLRGDSRSKARETTKQSPLDFSKEIATSRHVGTRNDEQLEIRISNTGPGIASDQLERIFDRFYQADTTYKKDGEGTGIGLALTKELVQACHGEIRVESKLDKMTTFTVLLPIGKEHLKPDEIVEEVETEDWRQETEYRKMETEDWKPDTGELLVPSIPPSQHPGKAGIKDHTIQLPDSGLRSPDSLLFSPVSHLRPPLLLIVEDNPDVTTYICSFLQQDCRIISAENGKEGWNKALQKFPDLVISDVMMPEMDGFELCKKIKSDQRTSHIPVILLTAKADLDSKIEGLEFGADDYISKPFEADELKVRAKNLVEQRQKLREKFSKLTEIKPGEIAASSMDEKFLERLLFVFEKHLSESGYSTESIAREVGMSRSHLHRKLKALTDLSTHEFILNMRLKRAAQLLKKKAGNVSEIAYTVGFENPANFSKAFKNQFGQSPRDFVKEMKSQ